MAVRVASFLGLFWGIWTVAVAQPVSNPLQTVKGDWARNQLNQLTLEQKIGQLFMVPCYTHASYANRKAVQNLIDTYQIGGIIFMKGQPVTQARWANEFQRRSKVPLLVATDAEWGLAMRLDSTIRFPKNLTLGAVQNDSLLEAFGREVGFQCRAVGVHVNFAPVVDVNNNPSNPVINVRSFGELPDNVARCGSAVARGLQQAGVLAVAKHFPGHGDTETDSHYDLPVLSQSARRLDTLELHPFRKLIASGVGGVMSAHLYIPALDKTQHLPGTLSPKIIQKLLKDSLKFEGIVFTDALNMAGVTKHHAPGSLELKALEAGNDMLEFSENVPLAIKTIKEAIRAGKYTEAELDGHVLKILLAKEWAYLHQTTQVSVDSVGLVLNKPAGLALRQKLYEEAITLIKNKYQILPLADPEKKKIAVVQVGTTGKQAFARTLNTYARVDVFSVPKTASQATIDTLVARLEKYTTVIVGIYDISTWPRNKYGISEATFSLLSKVRAQSSDVILTLFGSPYSCRHFGNEEAILVAYEEADEAQISAAQVIMGGLVPKGRLPIVPPPAFRQPVRYGMTSPRIGFDLPENWHMDSKTLAGIDTILNYATREKLTPSACVLAIRGNRMVYAKGFGQLSYNQAQPVSPFETIYDLASVTKVASTTLAIMKLYEQNRIELHAPINTYLTDLPLAIGHLTVYQFLVHKTGLPAFRQYYHHTLAADTTRSPYWYRPYPSDSFAIEIHPQLYLRSSFADSIWTWIKRLTPVPKPETVYSDINMIILGRMVEKVVGKPIEWYVSEHFYRPLGMYNTMFQPAQKCVEAQIPPTEVDKKFRFCTVQGYVNDETAALLGGVAGHAGLFATALDLGKLLLMLKNGGTYGGQRFLKRETITLFTAAQSEDSRRGLGWDKPEPRRGKLSPASTHASLKAYGHLGFTGCMVWVDPEYDLIYIFLSNRTYPNPANKRFSQENIRLNVMDMLYRSIDNYQLRHQ